MSEKEKNLIDLNGLKKLYEGNTDAQLLFNFLRTYKRGPWNIRIYHLHQHIAAAGSPVTYRNLLSVFRHLESLRCGFLRIGRRGGETRFEGLVGLCRVSKALSS